MPLNLDAITHALRMDYEPQIMAELGLFPDDGRTHEEHVAAHRAYLTELRRWNVARYHIKDAWPPMTILPWAADIDRRAGALRRRAERLRSRIEGTIEAAQEAWSDGW